VLTGGVVASLLTIGSTVYVFGLLVLPISKEFGLSRAEVNMGMMAYLTGAAIWGAFVGRVIDRTSIRVVMPIGGLLLTAGFVAIAATSSPRLMLAAIFFLIAMGMCCGGSLAANTVTARWFRRRRGRAMGLMALATSAGGFIVPPAAALLIGTFGWRTAIVVVGCVIGPVIALLGLFLMRDRPEPGEMRAAGELEAASLDQAASEEEREWTLPAMLRSANFWLLQISIALLMASDQALLALKVPFYQSKGVSLEAASVLLAAQSGSAVAGKILLGFMAERYDIRRIYGVICLLHVTVLLLFIHWPGYWVMLGLLTFTGIAIGGVLPVKLMLIALTFGSRSFGQVVGCLTAGVQGLSIVFIYLSGRTFDLTGNYDMVFWLFMGGAIVSFFLVQAVRLPDVERARSPVAGLTTI
jgi:sugar phosphate permease